MDFVWGKSFQNMNSPQDKVLESRCLNYQEKWTLIQPASRESVKLRSSKKEKLWKMRSHLNHKRVLSPDHGPLFTVQNTMFISSSWKSCTHLMPKSGNIFLTILSRPSLLRKTILLNPRK
uniref:Uncharacterized protein n=1 Tax=Cacopsylla melanoneura TaxID=428564 RepID=A0A8D8SHF0_9HEMI